MANENMDDIWWERAHLDRLEAHSPIKFDLFGETIIGRVKYVGHTYFGLEGSELGDSNNMIPRSGVCDVYSSPELDADLGI